MRLKTIYDLADGLAPFALSAEYCEKFGGYDNSGMILDCGAEIHRILFSLDCSAEAVAHAKETGADLLITHHPAIYLPVKAFSEDDAVLTCAKAGISILSAHLNLDCAKGGIDEQLMRGLGGVQAEDVMHRLSCGCYGRVFAVKYPSLAALTAHIEKEFCPERLVVYGAKPVCKIASFCGGGMDEESVSFAISHGADTFVSSDPKHHLVKELAEKGLNVVILTHYAAENYGFARFYENMKNLLKGTGVRADMFTDKRFL